MNISDYAAQIALIATIDVFKTQTGHEGMTIEEFLKLLDIELDIDRVPQQDKVSITDLTGEIGLHYDVRIDLLDGEKEEFLHIRGSSNVADNSWSFQISQSGQTDLHLRNVTSSDETAWTISGGDPVEEALVECKFAESFCEGADPAIVIAERTVHYTIEHTEIGYNVSYLNLTDSDQRMIKLQFATLTNLFSVSVIDADGTEIFQKSFTYLMPGSVEEYGSYYLNLHDTTENIDGWVFEETIDYFHTFMGNYTLEMSRVEADGSESLELNSTFVFVSTEDGYHNLIVDFLSEDTVFDLGCYIPPLYEEEPHKEEPHKEEHHGEENHDQESW